MFTKDHQPLGMAKDIVNSRNAKVGRSRFFNIARQLTF